MPITFGCSCGKAFAVDDALAGKRTRCPACQSPLTVPVPDAEPEVIEDFEVVDDGVEVVEDETPTAYGLADDRPPVPDAEPELVDDKPAGDGKPDYFVLAYEGGPVSKARVFRVYLDGDQLLFIHAGPFNWNAIDSAVGKNVAAGMIVRNGAMYGAAGAGLGLIAAGAIALGAAVDRKAAAKRAAILDSMGFEQLRAEAKVNPESFQVTAYNVAQARFEPPKTGLFVNAITEPHIIGRLKFTHDPTGKWALVILTKPDAKAAVREFRRLLGRDRVEVGMRLKKDRG